MPPDSASQNASAALAVSTIAESPLAVAALPTTPPTPMPAPTPEPRTLTHKVAWGDTLLSIALHYGARMEEITAANNLQNNLIYIGQDLTVPLPTIPIGAEQYTVQAGDSLYSIADALGIKVDDLMRANGMTNGYYLQVGQILVVPSGGVLPSAPAAPAGTGVQAASVANTPRTHVVQPGDSLSSLAVLYDVAAETIARANNITDPNLLQVGSTLNIP